MSLRNKKEVITLVSYSNVHVIAIVSSMVGQSAEIQNAVTVLDKTDIGLSKALS